MANEKILGALTYLLGWLTGIILYVLYKGKSKYVTFHAIQSTLFCVAVMVVNIILGITIVGIALVPFTWIGALIVWVFLMYKAYSGIQYKLPLIGDISEKYA